MNRHTQIRQAVLARLREQCGDSATFFDGLPAFIDAQELPAVAVWLSDAQYTGKMTDEDDWQAVLHIAVFIRAQAPDSELDMWMESTIFPALNDIPALTGLTVAPASASVKVGATTTLTFTVKPDGASDKAISVHSTDPQTATVTLNGLVATVKGVKQGSVSIVGMTSDGDFVAVAAVAVSAAG